VVPPEVVTLATQVAAPAQVLPAVQAVVGALAQYKLPVS